MRLPILLLAAALAGIIGGAWLIGPAAVGGAVIFDSLVLGALGFLTLDLPDREPPSVHEAPTLQQVLERANAS